MAHPRYWPTWFGLGLLRALAALPFPLLALLGAALGHGFYWASARRRRVARTNISRCFPALSASAHEQRVRAHFHALGQAVLATGIAWWGSARRVRRLVQVRNTEHLERALAAKRNVILLAPHFIGLEIGGIRISVDWPMVTVFAESGNAVIDQVMENARLRFRMQSMAAHRAPLMALLRAVRGGVPLYYLPDQNPEPHQSVFAPFFGIAAATYTTLGRLAQITNAVVIPCVTYLLPRGAGFETVFSPPLADFPSGDPVPDATRMNREIERLIAPYPAQYQWCYRRFKTQPPGEEKFYR